MLFLKVSSMLYLRAVLLTVFLGTCLASVSWAQQMPLSFSLDWHGPLQGVMDSATSTPITPGDILRPAGGTVGFGAPIPDIVFTGGLLGLVNYNQCVGSGPGTQCGVEVDAMSYGRDFQISDDPNTPYRILFSVDEYSMGRSMPGPSIFSEAPKGDICADIITTFSMPVMPVSPTQAGLHVSMVDGNGLFSQGAAGGFVAPGLGAVEPNIPDTGFPNGPFDQGSHVDALDFGPVNNPDVDSIWFSVDSGFFDPRAGVPNSGTSVAQGVSGGDVLERQASGVLRIYAKATDLGLDGAGPDTDDLDVLILLENGIDGFQPSIKPFDWLPSGGTDMLLFSVRRGSAIIGKPDSIQGLPICEGDLLGPAPPGLTHQNPGIYIAAESMGLSTSRSGGGWDDDTSGADVEPLDGFLDCQPNGIEDAIDIGTGGSPDTNANGIPDECEPPGSRFCFCDSTTAPCGNPDVDAGCANSTGVGARLDTTGSSSIFQDDLVLKTTNMPLNKFGMYFMGSGSASNVPVADGLRCVGGSWIRRFSALSTGSTGAFSMGPGMIDTIETQWGPGVISPGTTMYFQSWGRDVKQSPCGSGSNLSNGLAVTFTL